MKIFYVIELLRVMFKSTSSRLGALIQILALSLAVYITLGMLLLHSFFICKMRRLIYLPHRVPAELNELMYRKLLVRAI